MVDLISSAYRFRSIDVYLFVIDRFQDNLQLVACFCNTVGDNLLLDVSVFVVIEKYFENCFPQQVCCELVKEPICVKLVVMDR